MSFLDHSYLIKIVTSLLHLRNTKYVKATGWTGSTLFHWEVYPIFLKKILKELLYRWGYKDTLFLWIGFNCLKAREPLQGDSLMLLGYVIFLSAFLDVKRMFMSTVSFLA